MRTFLTLLAIVIMNNVISQTNIVYLNDTSYNASSKFYIDIAKQAENSYYIIATFNEPQDSSFRLNIRNIDSLGTLINQTNIYDTLSVAPKNTIEIKNNKIYIAANKYVGNYKYDIKLLCLDLSLNLLWEKTCKDSTPSFNSFIKTKDNGFIFIGYKGFILKTDSLGNEEWFIEADTVNYKSLTSILQDDDSVYYFAGYNAETSSTPYYNFNYYLGKIDNNGNLLKDTTIHNSNTDSHMELMDYDIAKSDNIIYLVGAETPNDSIPYYSVASKIVKLDDNFNILKDTIFKEPYTCLTSCQDTGTYFSYFKTIRIKNNGNLLVLDNSKVVNYCNSCYKHSIFEFTENLNFVKKTIYYPIPVPYSYTPTINDFNIEEDGSLYFIGSIENIDSNDDYKIWFIKTDTNYCDGIGSCDTSYSIEYIEPDTLVRTDTTDIKYIIHSNIDIEYNSTLIFYNYDTCNYIYYDTILNKLSNDTIFYPISFNLLDSLNHYPDIDIRDTICVRIKVAPSDSLSHYCTANIKEVDLIIFVDADSSIYVQQIKNMDNFIVYPNPANDFINVKISNLENKNNQIYIFNVKGELIETKLLKNHTKEIHFNITNYNEGTYYIKIGNNIEQFIKK